MATVYTLDSIIRSYIDETDNDHLGGYDRYLRIARNGLRDINMDATGITNVAEITVDENTLTAALPSNYIDYIGVFVCIGEILHPLGLNNNICLNRSVDDCGVPSNRVNFPARTLPNAPNYLYDNFGWNIGIESIKYRGYENYGGYFGIADGQNYWGIFRVDEEKNQIQFSNLRAFNIVLEYLADIEQVDGQYFVQPQVKEALIAYIAWASIRNKKGVAMSEINYKKMEYYRQKRNLKLRLNPVRMSEAFQTIRSTFRQSPKV